MTKSSRHKTHKQGKHSSKEYTDSEEDVKMKRNSKDENLARVHKEPAYGEKRKISSQLQEGKDGKDLSGRANGEVSKRRKEKADAAVGGDRWNGGGEERGRSDRNVDKESNQRKTLKIDSISKEGSSKGESMRIESKKKSRRHESGSAGEKKDDDMAFVVVDKEESKSKGESKKKSERDSSGRKEGKEPKDKDRRSENEKNVGQEIKLVDMDNGKKQASGDFSEDRQGERARDNTERVVQDESRNPGLEKENEKKLRSRREVLSERDKLWEDSKEGEVTRLSSGDHAKDVKFRDDKPKGGSYADKYPENGQKDEGHRSEKYLEEADKDNKHWDDKYREDGEKDARRKDDRHREDGDRINKRKDEKHRDDGERRRKDDKYREGNERDDKYFEDGNMDNRRKGDRRREDGDKDIRRGEDRYDEDGDRDDRRRDNTYRKDGDRESRQKDGKYQEDVDQDTRHGDRKQGDNVDRDKRLRDTKSRDEHAFGVRSSEQSDPKRPRDDGYAADHHSRKSSAHCESPTRDDRSTSYQDDHGRRRTYEKENYSDLRSRSTKDQRPHGEKRSARMDPVLERGRSTSRNADIEFPSSHSRRQSSPTLSSYAARDHYRVPKQDDSKYRDYSYEERARHNLSSSRDHAGSVGGFDQISSSRSLEKHDQKLDSHLVGLSAERRQESDIRPSSLQLVDKSQSSSTDQRQLSRSDVMRSIDGEKSTHRSGGSRDVKEYSSREVRGSWEDVLAGDECPQADARTLSASSPFMRNSNFATGSKSLPPPPPFSPVPLGMAEDDSRGKSNSRHRRNVDPNMGRIQGNNWRGVPGWPSPGPNGFLPFPHAPPPVGFHSVMHPFPVPNPMFSPYTMPNPERFSGPGHPMGWRNQGDGSGPSFNAWDSSNGLFLDNYGRPDWDTPGGRGWEASGDMWKGPNRSASFEIASSEKGNNSAQSPDEASAFHLIQPGQSVQTLADQQAESTDISQSTKSTEKNDIEAPLITLQEPNDIANMSTKDDVHHSYVYLSKLDISTDLAEPGLFNECTRLMDEDLSTSSDRYDSKILYMEEAVEVNVDSPSKVLGRTLFPSAGESVFQKAMSLYKRMNENLKDKAGEELKILPELIPNSDQADQNAEDNKTEKLLLKFDVEVDPPNLLTLRTSEQKIVASEQIKKEPISASETVVMGADMVLGLQEYDPVSDAYLPSEMNDMPAKIGTNNDEIKLVDVKCVPLVNSDVSSEVEEMMRESVLVNLSRIHHSPESTH